MIRLALILMLFVAPAFAKHPYDSVGRVYSKHGSGSGTVVRVEGDKALVATNAHVVANVSEVVVKFEATGKSYKGYTIHVDNQWDIALIAIKAPKVAVVPAAKQTRSKCVVCGYPYYDINCRHYQEADILFEIGSKFISDQEPVPGMSGGAVFDMSGNITGLIKARQDGIGYYVDSDSLLATLALYEDDDTWVKSNKHVEKPKKWNYAKPDGVVRTKKYDEKTAPDLKPRKPLSENTL